MTKKVKLGKLKIEVEKYLKEGQTKLYPKTKYFNEIKVSPDMPIKGHCKVKMTTTSTVPGVETPIRTHRVFAVVTNKNTVLFEDILDQLESFLHDIKRDIEYKVSKNEEPEMELQEV